jgi:outer membrane protein assembly factor BamB
MIARPLAVLLLATTPLLAQEWPRFRGPDGSGLSDAKIPAKWDDTTILWKTALPGVGHSSAVVWDDKVFTKCGDESTGAQMLVCVGAADGKVLWKREWTGEAFRHHGENSYASSTPAVDAEHVYVCLMQPRELKVIALKHDGSDAWGAPLGAFVTQHGSGQSPVVHGDTVVVANEQDGPGSFLVALDRRTGVVRWSVPRRSERFSASTPCVFRPRGGPEQLIFTSWAHGVTAINPADGAILWDYPKAFDARTVASAVAANDAGLVLASCGEGPGGHWLVAIRPPAQPGGQAELAYKITKASPYVPTPIVKGDRLYYFADAGIATCADVATGRTIWQERVPGGTFFGSPVIAGDTLFGVSKKGTAVALSASDQFKLLATSELGDKTDATPAVSGGRMFVRTYGHLFCIGSKENR